jgi:BirA family biotin operon repressor/biotin-[acetyl-CoA-carboxylase] ligase
VNPAAPRPPGEGDDLARLREHLQTARLGRSHEHHASLGSTNERAWQWLREGAVHGSVVTADEQSAGRGRRGRTWHSPPGLGIYASVLLRPALAPARLASLGLAVAVALREAVATFEVPVRCKWPNDLRAEGRKLGGILCEARHGEDACEVVVGFGLDVHAVAWPRELATVATSMAQALGRPRGPGRAHVLAAVLAALEEVLAAFERGGFSAIRGRYEPWCETIGQRVCFGELGDAHAPSGVAVGLADDGALLVQPDAGGPLRRLDAVDVWAPDPL